ncbi:hypothetical protein VNO78_33317 [Psophocarpus tetragonolobus]|uniref:Uncharacterized protein n=1 Tax=Psophocarpus tetragonolobus TaxID=3891 RepID=A0AAN9P3V7_PSOTE
MTTAKCGVCPHLTSSTKFSGGCLKQEFHHSVGESDAPADFIAGTLQGESDAPADFIAADTSAKLCMMLDFLGDPGSLTGVDVARHRLEDWKKEWYCAGIYIFQPLELIYYGQHSGVVGLTKGELYKTLSNCEIANHGYDKVMMWLHMNMERDGSLYGP